MVTLVEFLQSPYFGYIIVAAAFAIGYPQGHILGKALVKRFQKIQDHAKKVSVALFILFFANAIFSVPRFASPEKIDIANIFEATTQGEIASVIFTIFGVSTGFLAVLALSVTIISFVLLKVTNLSGASRVFVIAISLIILGITALSRFTDYTPTVFETFLYFLYQLGVTIGIVVGTAKKHKITQE